MTPQERIVLEGLMYGLGLPSWSARTPSWHADAACKETPEVNFFPERGESTGPAKEVCGRCLVRAECLEYARAEEIPAGVWGGEPAQARVKLTRKPRRSAA